MRDAYALWSDAPSETVNVEVYTAAASSIGGSPNKSPQRHNEIWAAAAGSIALALGAMSRNIAQR